MHSNFSEIESLVKSIGPASLIALSRKSNENKKWEKVQEFSNYLISLMQYQQKGFGILVEKYVRVGNFSQEYKNLRVLKHIKIFDYFLLERCRLSEKVKSGTWNHLNSSGNT